MKERFELTIKNIDGMENAAELLLSKISKKEKSAFCVALSGDLGAGKTTFSKEFAKKIGVKEVVTSPTYVLMRIYDINWQGFKKYVHIDAYRLNGGPELQKLGFDDLISNPEHLIFIEWPERVSDVLPIDGVKLNFLHGENENVRHLTIEI